MDPQTYLLFIQWLLNFEHWCAYGYTDSSNHRTAGVGYNLQQAPFATIQQILQTYAGIPITSSNPTVVTSTKLYNGAASVNYQTAAHYITLNQIPPGATQISNQQVGSLLSYSTAVTINTLVSTIGASYWSQISPDRQIALADFAWVDNCP